MKVAFELREEILLIAAVIALEDDGFSRRPKVVRDVENAPHVIKELPLALVDLECFPDDHDGVVAITRERPTARTVYCRRGVWYHSNTPEMTVAYPNA